MKNLSRGKASNYSAVPPLVVLISCTSIHARFITGELPVGQYSIKSFISALNGPFTALLTATLTPDAWLSENQS